MQDREIVQLGLCAERLFTKRVRKLSFVAPKPEIIKVRVGPVGAGFLASPVVFSRSRRRIVGEKVWDLWSLLIGSAVGCVSAAGVYEELSNTSEVVAEISRPAEVEHHSASAATTISDGKRSSSKAPENKALVEGDEDAGTSEAFVNDRPTTAAADETLQLNRHNDGDDDDDDDGDWNVNEADDVNVVQMLVREGDNNANIRSGDESETQLEITVQFFFVIFRFTTARERDGSIIFQHRR